MNPVTLQWITLIVSAGGVGGVIRALILLGRVLQSQDEQDRRLARLESAVFPLEPSRHHR